ncbi:MAG: hypothetical protein NUW37_18340 [Planctomycetes bacterium]|nr:hypothetical protein [Planctomycetota bacterium]
MTSNITIVPGKPAPKKKIKIRHVVSVMFLLTLSWCYFSGRGDASREDLDRLEEEELRRRDEDDDPLLLGTLEAEVDSTGSDASNEHVSAEAVNPRGPELSADDLERLREIMDSMPVLRPLAPPAGSPQNPLTPDEGAAQNSGTISDPEEIAVIDPYPGNLELFFGKHDYELLGRIFGQDIELKPAGLVRLILHPEDDIGGLTSFSFTILVQVTDVILSTAAFKTCVVQARCIVRDGEIESRRYDYSIDHRFGTDWGKRLYYYLSEGKVKEGDDFREVHKDCYDPATHLARALSWTWDEILERAGTDDSIDVGHIYVEQEEEEQLATIDRAARKLKLVFSERAFPGGGTAVIQYKGDEEGGVCDERRIELEYGPVGAVARHIAYTPIEDE